MIVTTSELMDNISVYLAMVDYEDIFIVKDGKGFARLTNLDNDKKDALQSLCGVIRILANR